MDCTIRDFRSTLYSLICAAISELIRPFGGSLDIELMYRYIDEDREQSIYRVTRIFLKGQQLWIDVAPNNGKSYASDVRFDYDEDFEESAPDNLSATVEASPFDLDYIQAIYNEVRYYAIPRKLAKQNDENTNKS